MKPLPVISTASLILALALLAGCGEDNMGDPDRIDAAPAAKIGADAIEPPEDERVLPADADQGNQETNSY